MRVPRLCRVPPGWVFAAGCLAAAVCIDLTATYHRQHQSDTLMPVLGSLYGWEPFVWEQNRVGTAVGLLAVPFTHPLTNLLVQTGVSAFLGLAALGVVAGYLLRDRTAAAVGAAAVLLFLTLFHPFYRFHALNGINPYLQPLGLALAGTVLVAGAGGRWAAVRVAGGLALTGVAYWSNFGLGVVVGPLVAGRFLSARLLDPAPAADPAAGWVRRVLARPANREFLVAVGLIAVGTAFGAALAAASPYSDTKFGLATAGQRAESWRRLAEGVWVTYPPYLRAVGWAAAGGLVWLAVPATRAAAARGWLALLVVAAGLAAQLLVVGATAWARMNGYDTRYLLAGVAALGVGAAAVLVGPPLAALPGAAARWVTIALTVLLPVAAVREYGRPSVAAARAGVDHATGRWTADVEAAGCTHLAGSYWCVWPAVFHTNLTRADRGDPRVVWAVTKRSGPTRPRWGPAADDRPRVGWLLDVYIVGRIPPQPPGTAPSQEFVNDWRPWLPHLREVGRRPTLWVYVRSDRPDP